MTNEQESPAKSRGSGMKGASIVLWVVGSLLLIAGIISFAVVLPTPYGGEIIIGMGIGIILLFVGAILYFIGRSREKEQSDLDEADIQNGRRSKSKNKKKTAGIILLVIGLTSVFISAIWMASCWNSINDIEGGIAFAIGFLLFIVALPIAAIGAILYIVGSNQQKKQENQPPSSAL